jgi:hypothetical protein
MLKSEIPVHRYHFHSQRERVFPQADQSKLRTKLDFGHAATLDLSNRTYMLAVESLVIHLNNGYRPGEGYALRISNTGYSSTRCTGDDQGNTATLLCTEAGIHQGNLTRSHMGTVITNPNFLNSYVVIELLNGSELENLDPQEVSWFSGTFVVYEYVPN